MMVKKERYVKRFLRGERGSVVVEASLYFVVFFLLCALLVDFSIAFLNKSYLERVTHSLASVVRERVIFYGEREALNQQDVNDLYEVAGVLLKDSRLAGNDYRLVVEAVFFQPSANNTQKVVLNTQSFTRGVQTWVMACNASVPVASTQFIALSPWDNTKGRWLPVYQVTVCMPGSESLFKRLLDSAGIKIGDISVSNAVIPR